MTQSVISFHYTLFGPDGKILETSKGAQPLQFLTGTGQIIPGLENSLNQLKPGDKKRVQVPCEEAYGQRDQALVLQVPMEKFPSKEVKVGDQFKASGNPSTPPLTVIEVNNGLVTLDANHPLAGIDLTFDVEIVAMREATAEECAHKHSHEAGS